MDIWLGSMLPPNEPGVNPLMERGSPPEGRSNPNGRLEAAALTTRLRKLCGDLESSSPSLSLAAPPLPLPYRNGKDEDDEEEEEDADAEENDLILFCERGFKSPKWLLRFAIAARKDIDVAFLCSRRCSCKDRSQQNVIYEECFKEAVLDAVCRFTTF